MSSVIVSLLYKLIRKSLTVPSELLRRGTAKDVEPLVPRHENAVLRRQLAGPLRYDPADRFWFAAVSGLMPRRSSCGRSPPPGPESATTRRSRTTRRRRMPPHPERRAHPDPRWPHQRVQTCGTTCRD